MGEPTGLRQLPLWDRWAASFAPVGRPGEGGKVPGTGTAAGGARVATRPVLLAGTYRYVVTTDGARRSFSTDGGANWASPTTPPAFTPTFLAGGNPGSFLATDGTTWSVSGDGGNTWTTLGSAPLASPTAVVGWVQPDRCDRRGDGSSGGTAAAHRTVRSGSSAGPP